jgi:hypothetical protein
VFTLLLTVILGVCIGAVAADLLFGPEQPATPIASSNGERWDPWRRWLRAARRLTHRTAQRVGSGMTLAARAVQTALAALVDVVWRRPRQAGRQALADLGAHRQARRQRHAAHARHVAHRTPLMPPRAAALTWADEDAPAPEAPGWPEPAPLPTESGNGYGTSALPPTESGNGYGPASLPSGHGNGTADGAAAGTTAAPRSPVGRTTTPDDPTLELAEPRTAEMPAVAPARPSASRTELAAPPGPVETAREPEPGDPGQRVPLVVPMRERLRALAILSVLVFVFGVAVASVLLVVILTLTRAVGGV